MRLAEHPQRFGVLLDSIGFSKGCFWLREKMASEKPSKSEYWRFPSFNRNTTSCCCFSFLANQNGAFKATPEVLGWHSGGMLAMNRQHFLSRVP